MGPALTGAVALHYSATMLSDKSDTGRRGERARPPTVAWSGDGVDILDQTQLPGAEVVLHCTTVAAVVDAIRRLAVRGAPAIGVAGAYGVALAALRHGPRHAEFDASVAALRDARPTATNLARMVDRVAAVASASPDAYLAAADAIRDEELAASHAIGERGADLLTDLLGDRPLRIMTICNTGGLATVERGTALAVIQTLHERGRLAEAIPLETRPLLQGGRLTTWELARMGAPHRLIVDSAAAFLLAQGIADAVLVGADRIAANGDTANKIGTFALALAARHARVPFIVVAPESSIDMDTPDGDAITIENRGDDEVCTIGAVRISPPGTRTINPAFDITPVAFIDAIVTDRRVVGHRSGATLSVDTIAQTA
jgi:methylthioribose-1-phosphate isomerase